MANKKRTSKGKMATSTIALAAAAVALLAISGVGSARAALTYFSEDYTAQVEMRDIGVTLVENGKDVSSRDYTGSGDKWDETQGKLLGNMLDETDGKLVVGRNYQEELAVKNSGNIDEYVRVVVYKYWDEKNTLMDPSWIDLNLQPGTDWIVDEKNSTPERTVLYYKNILCYDGCEEHSGATMTAPFSDTIKIDNAIASKVTETREEQADGSTLITMEYAYNGAVFSLEAEVDAVQTHNAQDAILSAWGVNATLDGNGNITAIE